MKKILVVFEGGRFSASALAYAIDIAKGGPSLLVGVFLKDMKNIAYTYPVVFDQPFVDMSLFVSSQKEESKKLNRNIDIFKSKCEAAGIHFIIHKNEGAPIQELLRESSFADLIVLDAKTSFYTVLADEISASLKDLLVEAHCPVLIVPADYSKIQNIVLSYDGSSSSTFAIKMFSYLFPEWKKVPATLLSINLNSSNHLAENRNMKDLLQHKFSQLNYEVLNGEVHEQLKKYLKKGPEGALVVMGAYGRNAVSRMFRQSLSTIVIRDMKVPVFITHH